MAGVFFEAPVLTIFIFIYSFFSAFLVLWMLNFVMARYDQMDALPIYQSYNLVLGIVCGLILLGEATRYSTGSLFGLFLACIVCVSGIAVLALKKTAITSKKNSLQEMADQLLLAELISEDDSTGGFGPDRIRLLDKDSFKLLKMLTTMIQETSKTVENDLDQERKSEERPQDFESTSLAGQSSEELINDSIQSSADDVDDCVCVA